MTRAPKSDSPSSVFAVQTGPGGVSFGVVVVPRASRSKIAGVHADSLKVTLAAPPVDGEANAELCKLLAKALGVPKRAVQITHGEHSKHKTVQVAGTTAEQVLLLRHSEDS